MPTLNINGQRVKVDDSFLSLSPEQQHAEVDHIAKSLPGGEKAPAQGGLWNSAADFFKSIPTGAMKGLAGTIAASGQAEAGQMGMEGAPGPEKSAQIMGVGSMHQPQGQAGRFGEAIGGALGNPTSYLGAGGMIPKALGAIGAGVGGQAAAEMFPKSAVAPFIGGALGGAVGGGLPRNIARTVTPNPITDPTRTAALKTLESIGAKPSAGDVVGSRGLRQAERLGDYIGGGGSYERVKTQPERAVTSAALKEMGETGEQVSDDIFKRSGDRLSRDFQKAEKDIKVRFDDKLGDGLVKIQQDVLNKYGADVTKRVMGLVDELMPQRSPGKMWFVPKTSKTGVPEMKGTSYASFTKKGSSLDRAIHDPNSDVGHFALQIRELLDDAMIRSARGKNQKAAVDLLKQARQQWYNRRMVMLSQADAKEAKRMGLVDPHKLVQNMQYGGPDKRMQFIAKRTSLQRTADAAKKILTPYKETGLAGEHGVGGHGPARTMGHMATTGIGAALGAATGNPLLVLAGAIGGGLAPGAAGRVINSPSVQRYLKNQFWIRRPETGSLKQRALVGGAVGGQAAQRKRLYEE
jgi:hypothetical protein